MPTIARVYTRTVQKINSPCQNLLLKEEPGKKVLSGQQEPDAFFTAGLGSRSELQTSVQIKDKQTTLGTLSVKG
jgi:hypothetical protein